MTMTPHLITEFLTPWVLAALAYPILFVAARRAAVSGPRVVVWLVMGRRQPQTRFQRRPVRGKDVKSAVLLLAAAAALAVAIDEGLPGPQSPWWFHPLNSGWEVSYGFATVLAAAAAPLLYLMATLLALVTAMAVASWLVDPVDDAPNSPIRVQSLCRAAAAWWSTSRRGRWRAVVAGEHA